MGGGIIEQSNDWAAQMPQQLPQKYTDLLLSENTTVVTGLLEDLVDRGLDLQRRYLVVIDGSKALRAGVERVFGKQAEVQRCQIHKRRNVKEYLPENCQKDYDRSDA